MRRITMVAVALSVTLGAFGEREVHETKKAPPEGRVSVENVAGSVSVVDGIRMVG